MASFPQATSSASRQIPAPADRRPWNAATGPVRMSESIQAVNQVLRAAAPDPGWRMHLCGRLMPLRAAFAEHREHTEGEEGLYAQVISDAPRLAHAVDGLVAEHAALDSAMATLANRAAEVSADAEALRRGALHMLDDLARHRQRVSDVVYEAYAIDIGGE